jgi:hypothetical protein
MLRGAGYMNLISDLDYLKVVNMDDGGMGSLKLFPKQIVLVDEVRSFGQAICEYFFQDEDEVQVIATINLDSKGELFELDVWKTNYTELKKLPDSLNQADLKCT